MDIETLGILLGAVLPIYPVLFSIHQRIGQYDEIVEEFKKLRRNTKVTGRDTMEPEIAIQPVATVTGLYRGKFGGLEPLTTGYTAHSG